VPDKNIEQELADLLANPEKVSPQHAVMLNELLQEYPYYQPLHLLLAKAGRDTAESNVIARAALYTSGQALHRFLFESRQAQPDLRLFDNPSAIGEDLPVVTDEFIPEDDAFPEKDAIAMNGAVAMNSAVAMEGAIALDGGHTLDNDDNADEQETFEEISEVTGFTESYHAVNQRGEATVASSNPDHIVNETAAVSNENGQVNQATEEDVFEEIGEVDYTNYRPFRNSEQENATDTQNNKEDIIQRRNSLEDDFVFESIASSDFFAFEQNFRTTDVEEKEAEHTPAVTEKHEDQPPFIEEHNEAAAAEVANGRVSNYHDDKLPYTFLWWLAKTRKEHQETFQPYAIPKKAGSQELQQQYVEHIFHIQSHLTGNEVLLDVAEPPKPMNKDFEIIDSFIKNDPQITPPNAEQIDNENKAKKSAEDQNDLVSETLANIYIEQMLYDKAIDTYEKLSLKFPEKSRYFADLIQSIEKKI